MRKRVYCVLLLILMVFCICGCSFSIKIADKNKLEIRTEAEHTHKIENAKDDTVLTDESNRADSLAFDSIEKVVDYQNEKFLQEFNENNDILGYHRSDFLYIYDGEIFKDTNTKNGFVPIESINYFNEPDIMWMTNKKETAFPVIDRTNGDQLVLVISEYISEYINSNIKWGEPVETPYPIYQLNFEGYCIPSALRLADPTDYVSPMKCFMENLISDGDEFRIEIDEIEGKNVSNTDFYVFEDYKNYVSEILTKQGYSICEIEPWHATYWYIMGEPGEKLAFGKYEGTMYQEYMRYVDTNLYSGNSVTEIEPRPTKEGYMAYDLSQLDPGLYIFLNKVFMIK